MEKKPELEHIPVKSHFCDFCATLVTSKTAVQHYNCSYCEKAFHKNAKLKEHINSVHLSLKPYMCDHCSVTFSRRHSLTKHVKHHCSGQLITKAKPNHHCSYCEKPFHKNAKLKEHIDSVHLGSKPYLCEHCPATFSIKDSLKRHVKLNCSGIFTTKAKRYASLDKHFKNEVLDYASKNTKTAASKKFNIHVSTVNSWEKLALNPKICRLCGKKERNESALKRHIEFHCSFRISNKNPNKQVNDQCNKVENDIKTNCPEAENQSFLRIVETDSNSNAKITCNVCLKLFSTETRLKFHKAYHHKQ